MSIGQSPAEDAPRRYTSATLTTGVLVAAILFGVAVAAETLGVEPGTGDMTDLAAVLEGLVAFTPWAWATAGAYAVLATPVLGLLVTAAEYWSVDDRWTVLIAASVLAILAISAIVALVR